MPYLKITLLNKLLYVGMPLIARVCQHFKENNLKETTVRDWLKIYKQEIEIKLRMAKEGEAYFMAFQLIEYRVTANGTLTKTY